MTVQGGKAEITFLKAPMGRAMEYQGTQYGDGNVCLTVSPLASDKAEDQTAGIIFWAADLDNFYVFEIQVSGAFCVAEALAEQNLDVCRAVAGQRGNSKREWAWRMRCAFKHVGKTATFFINDQQVGTFTGTPPGGRSQVGFFTGSSSRTRLHGTFRT